MPARRETVMIMIDDELFRIENGKLLIGYRQTEDKVNTEITITKVKEVRVDDSKEKMIMRELADSRQELEAVSAELAISQARLKVVEAMLELAALELDIARGQS